KIPSASKPRRLVQPADGDFLRRGGSLQNSRDHQDKRGRSSTPGYKTVLPDIAATIMF
ncbi:unnamed protein product, partial [Scytosiphon promiscuus]